MTSADMLVGVCPDRESIGEAMERLEAAGFDPDRISIVVRADRETPLPDENIDTRPGAEETAAVGGIAGAVAGAGLTGLIAIAGLTLSGFGLLAAGPLAGVLAAAVSGGVAGGLTGAMIGIGVPEDVARRYETQLDEGAALIAVSAAEPGPTLARRALTDAGVRDVQSIARS